MPLTLSADLRNRLANAWPDILQDIRNGERVDKTCERYGFDRSALWRYWSEDPQRRTDWHDAMRDSADAYVQKAIEAAENAAENPKAARVQLAAYQWVAEKRDPDKYGQRTRADINVKTVDLTAIIQDANARLAASRQHQIIDVTPSNPGADHIRTHALQGTQAAIAKAADLY